MKLSFMMGFDRVSLNKSFWEGLGLITCNWLISKKGRLMAESLLAWVIVNGVILGAVLTYCFPSALINSPWYATFFFFTVVSVMGLFLLCLFLGFGRIIEWMVSPVCLLVYKLFIKRYEQRFAKTFGCQCYPATIRSLADSYWPPDVSQDTYFSVCRGLAFLANDVRLQPGDASWEKEIFWNAWWQALVLRVTVIQDLGSYAFAGRALQLFPDFQPFAVSRHLRFQDGDYGCRARFDVYLRDHLLKLWIEFQNACQALGWDESSAVIAAMSAEGFDLTKYFPETANDLIESINRTGRNYDECYRTAKELAASDKKLRKYWKENRPWWLMTLDQRVKDDHLYSFVPEVRQPLSDAPAWLPGSQMPCFKRKLFFYNLKRNWRDCDLGQVVRDLFQTNQTDPAVA